MAADVKRLRCLKLILLGIIFYVLIDSSTAQQYRGRSRFPTRWSPENVSPQGSRSQFRHRIIRIQNPVRGRFTSSRIRPIRTQGTFLARRGLRSEPIRASERFDDRSGGQQRPISFQLPRVSEVNVPSVQRSRIQERGNNNGPIYMVSRSQIPQRAQGRQIMSGHVIEARDQIRQPIIVNRQQQRQFQMRSAAAGRISPLVLAQSQRSKILSNIDSLNSRSRQDQRISEQPRLSVSRIPHQPSISVSQISGRLSSPQGIQGLRPDQQIRRVPSRNIVTNVGSKQPLPALSKKMAPSNTLRQISIMSSKRKLPRVVSRVNPKTPFHENQPVVVSTVKKPLDLNTANSVQQIIGVDQQFHDLVPQTQKQTSSAQQQTHVLATQLKQTPDVITNGHPAATSIQQQTPGIATKPQQVQIITPEIHQPTLQGNPMTGTIFTQQVSSDQGNTVLIKDIGKSVLTAEEPGVKQSTVQYVSVAGSTVNQTPGTNPPNAAPSDIIFEELVNAFTAALENPAGQQTPVVQTNPIVHNMHPQTALQSTIQIQTQPGILQHGGIQHGGIQHGGIQHGGIVQAQPGIVQHGVMQHGGIVQSMVPMFGGQMHGHQFGFMNPWMMGGMNSAMMQEMMFGDTTDPPDPVATTTTTAAPTVTAAPDVSVNKTAPILTKLNSSADIPVSEISLKATAKSASNSTPNSMSADASIIVIQPEVASEVKIPVDTVPFAEKQTPVVADFKNSDATEVSNVISKKVDIITVPDVQSELIPAVSNADVSLASSIITKNADVHNAMLSPVKPTLQPAVTKASMTLEEKLMAEVKAMLANTQVDMSIISQVVGQVANELSGAAMEHLPSASQLGLETLVPDASAKKLSKKERVSELIGSTRGVVVYPPTAPTLKDVHKAHDIKADVIIKTEKVPNGIQNITSAVLISGSPIFKEKNTPTTTPNSPTTSRLPPHVEIPTLPPKTGNMDQSPEVYRTLQTILDHNPSALVKVLENKVLPVPQSPPSPKINVKSLVDIDSKSNLPNLQLILTDISTADKTNSTTNKTNAPVVAKSETIFEPLVNSGNGWKKDNSSANHTVVPKMNAMKIQPLMDGSKFIKANDITHDAFSSNLPTMPSLPSDNSVPTDIITHVEIIPTTPSSVFSETPVTSESTVQTWSFSTLSPFVFAETMNVGTKESTSTVNTDGVPVNISEQLNTSPPKLGNMEGVAVHMERIPTTEHPPKKLDDTGALSILQEIRSFGPNSSSSKHDAIANKLSDPNYVNKLRDLLQAMMSKTSVTSTPEPLWTDVTELPVSTTTLPISSTEEYEAEDFITETPAP